MHVLKKKEEGVFLIPYALIRMCPICARQDQIFPNGSTRRPKVFVLSITACHHTEVKAK